MKSKKLWLIPVLLVILISCFINVAGAATTLNVLYMKQAGYSEKDIGDITAKFEAENPEIDVNLIFVPYDSLHDKIVTAAATRSKAYDVALIDCIWTPEFARAGFLIDVTRKMATVDTNDIFEGVLSSVAYDGHYYGMPWLNDTKYLFYNKKILSKAGYEAPPATWEELIQQAKTIKEKGLVKYPIVWSWAQAEAAICDYTSLVAGFGGEILDEKGNPCFNQGAGLEVLKFMVRTINEGLTNPSSKEFLEEDVRRVFSQGEAAFAMNWAYMYNLANDPAESMIAGEAEIAVVPGSKKAVSGSVNGGMGLAIVRGSRNPDLAWEYIQFMAGKEVQIEYSANALPIYISAYDDPRVIGDQPTLASVSKKQYKYVVNRPQVTWYPQLSQILQVEIQKALIGIKSPEDALNDAADAAKKLKEKNK